jgi:diguanylate cyclase (GGDEF)-like protein/PAS domain S-box-containing protein
MSSGDHLGKCDATEVFIPAGSTVWENILTSKAMTQLTSSVMAVPESLFKQVVETTNDIIIITSPELDLPGPAILYINPAFTRLAGYEAHEVLGQSPRILQGPGTSRATLDKIGSSLKAGRDVHEKVLNYAKSGAPYWLDLRIVPLRDAAGQIAYFAAIERDVTLDKRRLDELEYVADRDTLTGIPNRRALLRSIDAEMQYARVHRSVGPCIAFVDVDRFKSVNDDLGHAVGDAVLSGVADRLGENIRRMDTVGRIGGEEFAVCMPNISLQEAVAISDRLRQSVSAAPFNTPAGPVRVTVSIGVAEAGEHEYKLSDLMARADHAMYQAKRGGRNRIASDPALSRTD